MWVENPSIFWNCKPQVLYDAWKCPEATLLGRINLEISSKDLIHKSQAIEQCLSKRWYKSFIHTQHQNGS